MLRRRPASVPPPAPSPPSGPSPLVERLRADGWVLPRGLQARTDGQDPTWTLVGTVASPTATAVDGAGLVVAEGWSLDWWIGADDRWHQPSIEPTVRQGPVGDAPVVETRLRIPGGDAIHRAYGVRSPRLGGDEWVVVEIENATPVPFAAALVLRPLLADRPGAVGSISVVPTFGGAGRDEAHLVRLDGRASLVLPRRPNRSAVGSLAEGDLTAEALEEAGEELASVTCPDGFATAALVYPVPHTAVLRVLVPVGQQDPAALIGWPSAVPDVAAVASGWDVQVRGPRLALPERRLADAFDRAARQVLLAHDGAAVHRDGRDAPDLDPGATEVLLGALDVLDRPADTGPVIVGWEDRLAAPSPEVDATVLRAVSRHHRLYRIDALLDWILPDVAAAVERIGRAARRGRLDDPLVRHRAAQGLADAVALLRSAGQLDAASAVAEVAGSLAGPTPALGEAVDRIADLERRLALGEPDAVADLEALVAEASSTGAWPGPDGRGRRIGHDLAASAALVLAVRALLVADGDDELALVPVLPPTWYGAGIELHDAPTSAGKLSFAVRWHGPRPALLWDLEVHDGLGPVRLTAPGLDPSWSTTVAKGEALLGEVAPPEGLDLYRPVPDHPDIDPVMRRPGDEPTVAPPSLPEGGSFS